MFSESLKSAKPRLYCPPLHQAYARLSCYKCRTHCEHREQQSLQAGGLDPTGQSDPTLRQAVAGAAPVAPGPRSCPHPWHAGCLACAPPPTFRSILIQQENIEERRMRKGLA